MLLRRIDGYGDNRYYFNSETGKFYLSATSFAKMVLPESPILTKWKSDLGTTEAKLQAQFAAHYGTLMHILIEEFLNQGEINLDNIQTGIVDYCQEHDIDSTLTDGWQRNLRKGG
jgi:hypothetical protein